MPLTDRYIFFDSYKLLLQSKPSEVSQVYIIIRNTNLYRKEYFSVAISKKFQKCNNLFAGCTSVKNLLSIITVLELDIL